VFRGAREGAQLDRLDAVVACGITQLIGLNGSPTAVGGHPNASALSSHWSAWLLSVSIRRSASSR
jgi:hypothetical protein